MDLSYLYLCQECQTPCCLAPLLSMQSNWQGWWFCHPGALRPLEDRWSISLWETLVFCHWSTKHCPQVSSFTSGKPIHCFCLRAWHCPETQLCRLSPVGWVAGDRHQARALIVMWTSNYVSLKYLQGSAKQCYFIWGNCSLCDIKTNCKAIASSFCF